MNENHLQIEHTGPKEEGDELIINIQLCIEKLTQTLNQQELIPCVTRNTNPDV